MKDSEEILVQINIIEFLTKVLIKFKKQQKRKIR